MTTFILCNCLINCFVYLSDNTDLSFTEEGAWKCLPETTISMMMIDAFNMIQWTCNYYSNWFYHVHCGILVLENKPDCVQICALLIKRLNRMYIMKRRLCLLLRIISIMCSYLSSNISLCWTFSNKVSDLISQWLHLPVFMLTFSKMKTSRVDLINMTKHDSLYHHNQW